MIEVKIPYRSDLDFTEITNWTRTELGNNPVDDRLKWKLRFENTLDSDTAVIVGFFKRQEDATLFKLTWG